MTNYRRIFQENSYLFITIVTFKRNPILIKHIKLLREAFKNAKKFYNYEIFGIVILPDHIHMIIKPENISDYPKIIFSIKYYFSKNINYSEIINIKQSLPESKIKKHEKGIWQRRYWEHTIRDEEDLYKHLDYIHYNPVKHQYAENVADWQYSSFYKFVKKKYYNKNWGNVINISRFKELDLE